MATKEIMRPEGSNVRNKTIQYVDLDYSQHSSVLVYPSTTLALTANTWKKVIFPTTFSDNLGEWNATYHRFYPKNSGLYLVSASIGLNAVNGTTDTLALYKNGSLFKTLNSMYTASGAVTLSGSALVKLFVGDYIELWARGTKARTVSAATSDTHFSCEVVG